jgi:hypothetical protein
MYQLLLMMLLLLSIKADAGVLMTPQNAMIQNYGSDIEINKKSILLNKSQFASISEKAKMKLSTKLYRAFVLKKAHEIVGYALLINETVRSKNAAVLYMIEPKGSIKAIEIVAFNEPPEYMPSAIWISQLKDKSALDELRVGKDIPTITGATMSARNIADGSRLALALYEVVLKP